MGPRLRYAHTRGQASLPRGAVPACSIACDPTWRHGWGTRGRSSDSRTATPPPQSPHLYYACLHCLLQPLLQPELQLAAGAASLRSLLAYSLCHLCPMSRASYARLLPPVARTMRGLSVPTIPLHGPPNFPQSSPTLSLVRRPGHLPWWLRSVAKSNLDSESRLPAVRARVRVRVRLDGGPSLRAGLIG